MVQIIKDSLFAFIMRANFKLLRIGLGGQDGAHTEGNKSVEDLEWAYE